MADRDSPSDFFHFTGSLSAIILPSLKKFPSHNFTFSFWITCDETRSVGEKHLLSFHTTSGEGYSFLLSGESLLVTTADSSGSKMCTCTFPCNLIAGQWYMLTLVFLRKLVGRSEIYFFLDGAESLKGELLSFFFFRRVLKSPIQNTLFVLLLDSKRIQPCVLRLLFLANSIFCVLFCFSLVTCIQLVLSKFSGDERPVRASAQ